MLTGIFRVAVSILSLIQSQLLAIEDMEGVAVMMKEWKKVGQLGHNISLASVWHNAADLLINDEVLLRLQESYAHELLSLVEVYSREHSTAKGIIEMDDEELERERQTSKSTDSVSPKSNGSLSPKDSVSPSLAANNTPIGPPSTPHKSRLLGGDTPTFWLLRYGNKLTAKTARELRIIHEELVLLDQQVDRDKQLIQQKIVRVCDAHREASEGLTECVVRLHEAQKEYLESCDVFTNAVQEAQRLSFEAATYIDTLERERQQKGKGRERDGNTGNITTSRGSSNVSSKQTTPIGSTKTSEGERVNDGERETVSKTRPIGTGPIRKIIMNHCLETAREKAIALQSTIRHSVDDERERERVSTNSEIDGERDAEGERDTEGEGERESDEVVVDFSPSLSQSQSEKERESPSRRDRLKGKEPYRDSLFPASPSTPTTPTSTSTGPLGLGSLFKLARKTNSLFGAPSTSDTATVDSDSSGSSSGNVPPSTNGTFFKRGSSTGSATVTSPSTSAKRPSLLQQTSESLSNLIIGQNPTGAPPLEMPSHPYGLKGAMQVSQCHYMH